MKCQVVVLPLDDKTKQYTLLNQLTCPRWCVLKFKVVIYIVIKCGGVVLLSKNCWLTTWWVHTPTYWHHI